MTLRRYKPRDNERVVVDSVAIVTARGFLCASAPAATIDGRPRVLLTLDQRRALEAAIEPGQRYRLEARDGSSYLPGQPVPVLVTGRFRDTQRGLTFYGERWASAENLWADVEALLLLPRAKDQSHGSMLLWALLEETARRAGLVVQSP